MYAGNLQHSAIQQDTGMIGRRDGKSERILAEWHAAKGQLWQQTKSPNHRDWTEVGLQKTLSVSVWRVCANA